MSPLFICPLCTVHKVNDWLHPMQCIPETQFLMRSKIHLAMLLHLWCKCERAEDCSQFELILIKACFIGDPRSNPVRSKKLRQSWNILKAVTLGREPHSSWLHSTTLPLRHTYLHINTLYFYSLDFLRKGKGLGFFKFVIKKAALRLNKGSFYDQKIKSFQN